MNQNEFESLTTYIEYPESEMLDRSTKFLELVKRRRTVRQFSNKAIPKEIIENCILAAGTAPSGANTQPWHFVVISDPELKAKIRVAAEEVEADFYNRRAPEYWLKDLEPLGTDANKPYLEIAPYLIVIMTKRHTVDPDGNIRKHYYLAESVGIATGILITALHNAGLCCLTHTPSPMSFLRDVLDRPKEESPFLLLAVGYPSPETRVPKITKKSLDEIALFK